MLMRMASRRNEAAQMDFHETYSYTVRILYVGTHFTEEFDSIEIYG